MCVCECGEEERRRGRRARNGGRLHTAPLSLSRLSLFFALFLSLSTSFFSPFRSSACIFALRSLFLFLAQAITSHTHDYVLPHSGRVYAAALLSLILPQIFLFCFVPRLWFSTWLALASSHVHSRILAHVNLTSQACSVFSHLTLTFCLTFFSPSLSLLLSLARSLISLVLPLSLPFPFLLFSHSLSPFPRLSLSPRLPGPFQGE